MKGSRFAANIGCPTSTAINGDRAALRHRPRIHSALELAQQSHRFLIAERQKLHQQYRADAAPRVDPEVSILQPSPGQASRRPASFVRRHVNQEAEAEPLAE